MQREATPTIEMNNEELLRQAAEFSTDGVGYNRGDDGRLADWHQWAASHPQGTFPVGICHGRAEWEEAKESCIRDEIESISLVSWNILSDTWYEEQCAKTYTHTPREQGIWSGRLPLLVQWIEKLSPDVLTLQEVDFVKFDTDMLPSLEAIGYSGIVQSQKKQSSKQPCGVATFWKSKKLELVRHKAFSRSMATVFKFFGQSGTVCIVNVHLESSQTMEGADKRARQLNSPLQWSSRVAADVPLIVSGDCNTGSDAALFNVLRNCRWHGHGLASVYEHPAARDTLPVVRATFFVPNHHYVIDHMLYTYDNLRLRHVMNAFSSDETEEHLGSGFEKGFPNSEMPSDHIPVGAIFDIASSAKPEEATKSLDEPLALRVAARFNSSMPDGEGRLETA